MTERKGGGGGGRKEGKEMDRERERVIYRYSERDSDAGG